MTTIGLAGAFLGGILTLISPCSALLLPAFFSYSFDNTKELMKQTLIFFAGLCSTLVPIGMGLAALLTAHRDTAITVGGWIIIALGVYTFFGFGFSIPGLSRLQRQSSTFLLGAVYGFAGLCAGPLLGAVLTTAAVSGSVVTGALTMATYALGMAAPLFLLAMLWEKFDPARFLRGRPIKLGPIETSTVSMISGAVFVGIGILFLTSYGTAALPGIVSTDTQFAVQEWVQSATESIDNRWLLFTISAIATAVVGWKAFRPTTPTDAA